MIEVVDVSVAYEQKEVLHTISLTIPQGRIVMMLGENGSGKTTLMKAMLDKLPLLQGDILWNQVSLRKCNEKQRAACFSYVPQIKEMVGDIKVSDCIVAGCTRRLSLFEVPSPKEYAKANAILKQFQLEDIKDKYLQEISGGELQMTYVARAFLQDSEVILMDEPCTYLDFQHQHLFLQQAKQLAKQGKSLFISIHDPNLALQYGDDIYILHEGRLSAHLKKEEPFLRRRCCECYNTIYGNHFALAGDDSSGYLVWKE